MLDYLEELEARTFYARLTRTADLSVVSVNDNVDSLEILAQYMHHLESKMTPLASKKTLSSMVWPEERFARSTNITIDRKAPDNVPDYRFSPKSIDLLGIWSIHASE